MVQEIHKKFAVMAIDALGGSTKVAELFGVDERLVSNWRRRGLPPDTFWAMEPMLTALNIHAPPVMWRQRMLFRKRMPRPPRPKNGRAEARS